MRTRVQKWGNSLALRIPRSFASETRLENGSEVDLATKEGRLIVTPVTAAEYDLDELLASVTPRNLHGEVWTSGSVGRETW